MAGSMTMLAARLRAAGEPLVLERLPLPEPSGSQVRVRVAGCGVCHTDLHIARGAMTRVELPITLGHEIAGWIDAAGPDASVPLGAAGLRIGDGVLVFGGWGCGACTACCAGEEQRCPTGRSPGFQEDGGYADAVLVPHPRHLVPLSGLDPVLAAPLADAGVTPYRAVERARPWLPRGAAVVVIGAGALGQFALQFLQRLPDLRLAIVEPIVGRRGTAEELGAGAALPDAEPAAVRVALGGEANVVFDFVGTDETLSGAGRLIGPGGLVMLVGEGGGHASFGFNSQLESWITTTAWGSLADLKAVVAMAANGDLRWSVEAVPLREAQEALRRVEAAESRGRLVLVPSGTA